MDVLKAIDQLIAWVTTGRNSFIISLLICEALFSISIRPRSYSRVKPTWLPMLAALLIYFLVGFFMPAIPLGRFTVPMLTLTIYLFSILLQWVVLDISGWRALFNSTAAYAMQNLAVNTNEVLNMIFPVSGWEKIAMRLMVKTTVYIICYFMFARKCQKRELHLNKPIVVQLALVSIFISNFLFSYFALNPSHTAIKIPLGICCFLSLQVQFATFWDSSLNKEKEILEQMLFREQKQHELLQEAIDIINIKSHDLKHQIGILRSTLGGQADDVIREVENAITAYNSLVSTGNKNLDLIISEEKLLCEKYAIPFDIMADGGALAFVKPVDLYSLIGNALRNAVESSLKESKQQREIRMDIHSVGKYVCVEIINYCSKQQTFVDGIPVTSKDDCKFHGFGMKSMQYIVDKYDGHMVIQHRDNYFQVKVIIPAP